MRRLVAAGAALLIVAACAGCAGTAVPRASAPEAGRAVECQIDIRDGTPRTRTVELRIPDGYESAELNDGVAGCRWSRGETVISIAGTDPDHYARPLESDFEDLKGDVGVSGDDEVEDLHFDRGVEIYPGVTGVRLAAYTYSDGSPSRGVSGEGDGVQLSVGASDPHWRDGRVAADTRALFDAIAATMRIAEH